MIMKRLDFFIRLLCLYLLIICADCDWPTVNTSLGSIHGYYIRTRGAKKISAFTGIPYSVAPVGELRFKAPVPIPPWEQPLNATQSTPICVQRNPYVRQQEIVGQEDCLYLNIYTPYKQDELLTEMKLLPVMVFIHGGGWMCGDSTTIMYGPHFLLDKDVVLVTMNYRLGPLGFLSTHEENCPGNNGLKDQQEALRFLHKTIKHFGGDRDSVTLFGESAGGASVHFHMISKTSYGLFHRAISESGTALVPWAEASPGEALRNAFRLAKFLDCPQTPSKTMLKCLRNKNSYDIIDTEYRFYGWDYEPMTPFKAVVEPDLPEAFLTKQPREIPDVPAVPWMTGLNKDEGALKSIWITSNKTRFQEFISGFSTIAPVSFYYDRSPNEELITSRIKEKYLKSDDEHEIKKQIANMYSDSYFSYPALEAVELVLKYSKQPVYLYELTYRATNSFSQIFGDPKGDYGVSHADELMHLFPIHFLNKPVSQDDLDMSETIVTMWTNFATSGDPNKPNKIPSHWEPTRSGAKAKYLDIGEKIMMKENLAPRSRFWGSLPLWHNTRQGEAEYGFDDEL